MATKKSIPLYEQAANAYRQRYAAALTQAPLIREQEKAKGAMLTEKDDEDIASQLAIKGDYTPPESAYPSVVIPTEAVLPQPHQQSAAASQEAAATSAYSGPISESRAMTAEEQFDQAGLSLPELASTLSGNFRAGVSQGTADLLTAIAPLAELTARYSPVAAAVPAVREGLENVAQGARSVAQERRNNAARIRNEEIPTQYGELANQVREENKGFFGQLGMYARNPSLAAADMAGVAGNILPVLPAAVAGPTGLSVAGGVQAAGNVYDQVYTERKKQGASDEEASKDATRAFAISLPVNIGAQYIPGGMGAEKILAGQLAGKVTSRAPTAAAAKAFAGEYASNVLPEVLDQANVNLSTGKPWNEQLAETAAVATVVASPLATLPAVNDYRASRDARDTRAATNAINIESGAQEAKRQYEARQRAEEERRNSEEELRNTVPVQEELFPSLPQESRSYEEQEAARQSQLERDAVDALQVRAKRQQEDAAWEQRRQERTAEEAAVEDRAGMRSSFVAAVDTARERVEELQDAVDGGATDQATLNALRAAVSDMRIAEGRLAAWDNRRANSEANTRTEQNIPTPAAIEEAPTIPTEVEEAQDAVDYNREQLEKYGPNPELNRRIEESEAALAEARSRATTAPRFSTVVPAEEAITTDAALPEVAPEAHSTTPIQEDLFAEQEAASAAAIDRTVEARKKAVADKLEKDRKNKEAAAKAALSKALDRAILDNPEATNEELYAIAQQNAATANTKSIKDRVEEAVKRVEAAKKRSVTVAENKRISALLRAGRSPEEVIRIMQGEEVSNEANSEQDLSELAASSHPLDRAQAEAARKLGIDLGMAAPATTNERLTVANYARKVGEAIARDSSGRAAAVEQLIRDGKLIIAPSAESIGRHLDENGNPKGPRKGEYDDATGKQYIYADRLSDNIVADIIEAASHESGHSLQFKTTPEERATLVDNLVGAHAVTPAAAKIRAAAKKGNKLAQDAVAAATEDTRMRRADGQENPSAYEDHEVVAYLIGKENRKRSGMLGSLTGATRDLVSGARSIVRSKLGVAVDINFNDLRTAASRVLQEAADRPARPSITARAIDSNGNVGEATTLGMADTSSNAEVETYSEEDTNAPPRTRFRNLAINTGRGRTLQVGNLITSAFRNDKGLGEKVLLAIEDSKQAPVVVEAEANALVGDFDYGINKLASNSGRPAEEIRQELTDKLEALANEDISAGQYRDKFDSIVSEYGEAGEALKSLRNLEDTLSLDYINYYINHGGKLTEAETKEVKTILNNLGRYVHRFYASQQGGKTRGMYSDALFRAVEKKMYNATHDKQQPISPREKELLEKYEKAARYLADDLAIPADEDLYALPSYKVEHLYDVWIPNKRSRLSVEEKMEALSEFRKEVGAEDLDNKIKATIEDLVKGVDQVGGTRYYRGIGQDRGQLKKRSSIAKPLREVMGEVTDPAVSLLVTIGKTAELVARTKVLHTIKEISAPEDLQPPTAAGSDAVKANNMTILEGEEYGPLQGWFVSPALRSMIGSTRETLMNFTEAATTGAEAYSSLGRTLGAKAADLWMKGASTIKAKAIIGNLFNYPLNSVGSFASLALNGNIDPRTYKKAALGAAMMLRYAANPGDGLKGKILGMEADASPYVRWGITDSAQLEDFKKMDANLVDRTVRAMSGASPGRVHAALKTLGLTAREAYALTDVWAKMANFDYEVAHLTDLYKAAGIEKTADEINEEASAIVKNTNIGHNRSLPVLKALERGGFTMFGPYLYDTYRVQYTNAAQGVKEILRAKDMPTAKAKALTIKRGTQRLLGQAAVYAAMYYLSNALGSIFADNSGNEKDKRSILPSMYRVSDLIPVGFDKDDKLLMFTMDRADPYGPFTNLIRAARAGGDIDDIMDQFKDLYIRPAMAPLVFNAAAHTAGDVFEEVTGVKPADVRDPKTPLIQEWFPNAWGNTLGQLPSKYDKTVQAWANIAEALVIPGTLKSYSPNSTAIANPIAGNTEEEQALYGATAVIYSILKATGARFVKYDPEVAARNAAYGYKDAIDAIRDDLYTAIKNRPNVSADYMLSNTTRIMQEEKKQWDNMASLYRGLKANNMSDDDIFKVFKEAKLPTDVIRSLRDQEFRSQLISKASFKAKAQNAIRKASDKEKEVEKWERAWSLINGYTE